MISDPMVMGIIFVILWLCIGCVGLSYFSSSENMTYTDIFYMMCQILTTVGYGDLNGPETDAGYLFYCIYVLMACLLIAQVVGVMVGSLDSQEAPSSGGLVFGWIQRLGFSTRFQALLKAALVWCGFVFVWVIFFTQFPGEEFRYFEAVYFGVITLTTVGFGDKVPNTDTGKIFACIWMVAGSGAFSMMLSKFGVWSFFLFNKITVEKLDKESLKRILEDDHFNKVANARINDIEQLIQKAVQGDALELHKERNKISRNDFLMFMCIDMGLVDNDIVNDLSTHFDRLDHTGEGYIDREDLEQAIEQERKALAQKQRQMNRRREK